MHRQRIAAEGRAERRAQRPADTAGIIDRVAGAVSEDGAGDIAVLDRVRELRSIGREQCVIGEFVIRTEGLRLRENYIVVVGQLRRGLKYTRGVEVGLRGYEAGRGIEIGHIRRSFFATTADDVIFL